MRFEDVLPALREGKKVKRSAHLWTVDKTDPENVSIDHLLETDWEVVEEHKLCPFCGGKAFITERQERVWPECKYCKATLGTTWETLEEAWAAWDRRV